MAETHGLGKCRNNHIGSYGYPTRPEEPYLFCPRCGNPMVWACPKCETLLPEDNEELSVALYCRQCGSAYFEEDGEQASPADKH
ncbi:MAG: DUF2321 domain-containing protein [Chloroflexi bacterium]|nr:DUF2321 domain-containing protein [Chloroflexota bacterium]